MNLEIQKAELMERVNAHIQSGHFHNADEVIGKALDALDERVPPAGPTRPEAPENMTEGEPFWKDFTRRVHALPDEVFERLPADGASEHDHYLYGTPKRNGNV